MFQSVVEPATAVAGTGVEGAGRLHEVTVAALPAVVVGEADDDEQAVSAPATTRATSTAAAGRRRRGDGAGAGGGRSGGVLPRDPAAAIRGHLWAARSRT